MNEKTPEPTTGPLLCKCTQCGTTDWLSQLEARQVREGGPCPYCPAIEHVKWEHEKYARQIRRQKASDNVQ